MKNFSSIAFLMVTLCLASALVEAADTNLTSNVTTALLSGKDTFPGVTLYLAPNLLIAILFMLFVFGIMIVGFLLLMDVQTPSVFSAEKIDFGKIEK